MCYKLLLQGSQNNGTPLPAQMYYLKLYLDLMEGEGNDSNMVIMTNSSIVLHWMEVVHCICEQLLLVNCYQIGEGKKFHRS